MGHPTVHACRYVQYIPIKAIAGMNGFDQYKMISRVKPFLLHKLTIGWAFTKPKIQFMTFGGLCCELLSFLRLRFCAPLAFFHIVIYQWMSPENQKK